MKELYNHQTVLKFENEISIGERLTVGGYVYTKTSDNIYENSSTIIEIHRELSYPYTSLVYKSKYKDGHSYNPYGQMFKKNQF